MKKQSQNKPNLLNAQMNVTSVITKDYENERFCRCGENKPKQTQFLKIPDHDEMPFSAVKARCFASLNMTA